jgi:hypothetical protein
MKMKKISVAYALLMLISLLVVSLCLSQPKEQLHKNWSSGTAFLLPEGRMEIGIFQPMRYGWSKSVEFSIHPLAAFIIPNLSMKWSHGQKSGYKVATRHSISYPTLLLRTVSKKGIGGMISPEFQIPHMISIYNEVIVSKKLSSSHLLSVKSGISFALKSGDLDENATIDLPIIFPRLAVYHQGYGFRFGSDLHGKFYRKWDYLIDADVFYTPRGGENFALEHKGLLLWNKSERFQFCIGYKLVYGEYPFGSQWHLFLPILDLQCARMLKGN